MATIGEKMTAIANAIRTKTGGTEALTLDQMASSLNNIAERTSSNLTASGATVSVPAGNYKAAASKSVATATQATPSVSIDSDGKITATSTQSAGYVSGGTTTGTKQLTVQAAKTVTPSTSSQTAVASGVYTTGAVTVAAMPTATQATPSISVSSTGLITASATQTAGYVAAGTKSATSQLPTKTAQTFVPTTWNQSISAGLFLKDEQIIQGDGNLVSGNIKNGVSIFGVVGSYKGEEITTLYAYNHGDQCTSVSGGWVSNGGATFYSGYAALQGKGSGNVGMYTAGAIDMTPWKTMFVYAEVTNANYSTGFQGSCLVSASSGGAAAGWGHNTKEIFTKAIDVSSLSGYFSIRILMGASSGCRGNVYAVYFQK